MATLETLADRCQENPVGAHLSLVLAQNLTRPSYRITEEGSRVEVRAAQSEQALALTERALKQQKRDKETFSNIGYHQLRRTRADLMVAAGEKDEAKKELRALARDLKKLGVNRPVLDQIETYAKGLWAGVDKAPARQASGH